MAQPPKPASDHPSNHPWFRHIPAEQRSAVLRAVGRRKLRELLSRRRSQIIALALIYALLCSLLLILAGSSLLVLALLPMLLLPAVAGLAWWLTWKEFHH